MEELPNGPTAEGAIDSRVARPHGAATAAHCGCRCRSHQYAVWGWQPGTSTSAKAGLSDREMRNALDVCGLGGADLGGSLLRAYSVGADSGQLHREAVELGTGLHHMHSANGSAPPRNTVHQGETPARAH